tara:strand:- start:559 stop:1464 length:906 start_codon:yes stop_codon:yes gene_type:complete
MDQNTINPLVSIVVNCYNGEKYLSEALNSVVKQTYKNWELIFWDNQSTDKSKQILLSYKQNKFKYFLAPKHTNLYEARNLAIKESKGIFIAFLDVDDWWNESKLEKQIPYFKNPNVGLVYGNCWIVDERKIKKKIYKYKNNILPTGNIFYKLLNEYVISLPTIIVRKKIFKNNINPFDSQYHIIGDFDFCIRLSLNWQIECCQSPIAYNRIHQKNESIVNYNMQTAELEEWIRNVSIKSSIPENQIINLKNMVMFRKAKSFIKNNIYQSFIIFLKLPFGFLKLKLFINIILGFFNNLIKKK